MGEGIVGVPEEEDTVTCSVGWDKCLAQEVRDWHHGKREYDAEDCRGIQGEGRGGRGGRHGDLIFGDRVIGSVVGGELVDVSAW